jgi:hypothetical protein
MGPEQATLYKTLESRYHRKGSEARHNALIAASLVLIAYCIISLPGMFPERCAKKAMMKTMSFHLSYCWAGSDVYRSMLFCQLRTGSEIRAGQVCRGMLKTPVSLEASFT